MGSCRHIVRHQSGMTLLEVMVAVALTAVAGVIAFAAIQSASESSLHLRQHNQALKQLDNAVHWLVADIRRTIPLVSPLNDKKSAAIYMVDRDSLTLSVRGFDSAVSAAGALSRVEYRLQEGTLLRKRMAVTSHVKSNSERDEGSEEVLLGNIQKFDVRFLDAGTAKLKEWPAVERWYQQWPVRGMPPDALPWAIWFSLEGEQVGRIERLIEVSGSSRD